MAIPPANRGSRKGIPNKLTAQVKENIVCVFTTLGGTRAMAEWASENKTEFYKLYAKLIPTQAMVTIDVRDASELSDEELLAIATGSSLGVMGEETGEEASGPVH